MPDLFPSTARAWIEAHWELGEPGRRAVNHHVMEVYSSPLAVYYRGGWRGSHGEADDVIAGFFADRLARADFLPNWLSSDLPLRIWLCKALSFYLKEQRREDLRAKRHVPLDPEREPTGDFEPPSAIQERAFARSIVQQALVETRAECAERDQLLHWEIFVAHVIEDLPYARVVERFENLTEAQAAVLVRPVVRHFRAKLRLQLVRDGVRPERIDREIEHLLRTGEDHA